MDFPSKQYLLDTHNLIKPHIVQTPLFESELINKALGVRVLFKCENF
jgi:threonine dehydratase